MSENIPKIYKTNGDLVPFSKDKVKESLIRSGAKDNLAEEIANTVADRIEPKMSTSDIYKMAFNLLKDKERPTAARYTLKRSIMDLGPTGFPFERFVGKLLDERGFETKVGVKMKGICISHEVDVLAKKEEKHYLMECKFHNKTGIKTNVHVPMYINSRFEDIENHRSEKEKVEIPHDFWVVTNTRFTDDAIDYGECVGMNLLGWRYPEEGGLEEWIEESGLLPVTCLTTLNDNHKKQLLERELVLCKDLVDNKSTLREIGMNKDAISKTIEEVRGVCRN